MTKTFSHEAKTNIIDVSSLNQNSSLNISNYDGTDHDK